MGKHLKVHQTSPRNTSKSKTQSGNTSKRQWNNLEISRISSENTSELNTQSRNTSERYMDNLEILLIGSRNTLKLNTRSGNTSERQRNNSEILRIMKEEEFWKCIRIIKEYMEIHQIKRKKRGPGNTSEHIRHVRKYFR